MNLSLNSILMKNIRVLRMFKEEVISRGFDLEFLFVL